MFTKTQFIAAAVVLASTLSANAAPTLGQNGWVTPSKGKGRDGKIRQAHEALAVDHHRATDPTHPANAHGNTAHVHDTFHSTHGGPVHATVKYNNPHGDHITTLHIAKDGTRLQGAAHPPAHHSGTHAPPNSPKKRALERRTHGNGGWITPAPGKGKPGKVRQAHEIAAVEHHKATEPHHPAVAHGNSAHVHDAFHSTHGGPEHATVKYSNTQGHHVTTLHIAKDGTRLQGGAHPSAHHSGTYAPPNSPARRSLEKRTHGNGGRITPAPGKGKPGKVRQAHEIAAVEHHKPTEPHHSAVVAGNKAHVHDTFHSTHSGPEHATVKYSNTHGQHTRLQGGAHPPVHHSGIHAPPNSPVRREYMELLDRALDFYDDLN